VFAREQIVYLTAESETVLDDLDPDAVYVIGGLVDHNRLKGVCHERATALGLKTAQLPIAEHLQMSSRKVLTVNHVFEILSRYLETKSWTTALQAVIPQRKGAVLKAAPTAIGDLGEKVDGKGEKANDSAANSTPGAPAAGSGLGVDEKRADEKTAAPGAPSD
jgi:tRNA (guanine9-N1)-methyltransferase